METNINEAVKPGSYQKKRHLLTAMKNGASGKCPSCGTGKLFRKYLKPHDHCPSCNEALHHHQADDAPPYFTIFILGHILVPLVIYFETTFSPPLWWHVVLWFPVTIILALILLQITKGATIGLQWAFEMHGFGNKEEIREDAD